MAIDEDSGALGSLDGVCLDVVHSALKGVSNGPKSALRFFHVGTVVVKDCAHVNCVLCGVRRVLGVVDCIVESREVRKEESTEKR